MEQEQRELEKIAEEFNDRVECKTEEQDDGNVLLYLFYNDDNSGITAREDTKGKYAKIISYQIRCAKVKNYLEPLTGLKNNLSGRILAELQTRDYKGKNGNTSENLSLAVEDFRDLPELIRMHLKIASSQV
ncbi:hypothetical protein HYX16_01530 [Candidatus Woesearchaeota archaeon]|nr:hypothetical protein [Candidatus Woesearchaeota archaeon]